MLVVLIGFIIIRVVIIIATDGVEAGVVAVGAVI